MAKFSQKTDNFFPKGVIWAGYVFIAASIAITITNLVVGLLFAALALLIVSGREGVVIDADKMRLKMYWGIYGLKFGKWETIPNLEKITISPEIKGKTKKTSKVEVRLYYEDIDDYILAFRGKATKAKHIAEFLSKRFKVKLVDYHQSNGKK